MLFGETDKANIFADSCATIEFLEPGRVWTGRELLPSFGAIKGESLVEKVDLEQW